MIERATSGNDLELLKDHPLDLGAKLHVWCDDPTAETEEQIAVAIKDSLRALAQTAARVRRLPTNH